MTMPATNTYDAQLVTLERRRALADKLREQSMQGSPGEMAGRVYVPTSPVEGLARVLQAYTAKKRGQKIDAEEQSVNNAKQAEIARIISSMPEVGQDDSAAVTQLAGLDPGMAGIVSQLRGRKESIAAHSADVAAQAQARREDLQARLAAQAQNSEAQRDLQRQLAEMSQSNRPQPAPVAVVGDDGNPVLVPQGQAAGKAPYYPPKNNQANNRPVYDSGSDVWVTPPTPENPNGSMTAAPARQKAAQNLEMLAAQFMGTDKEPGIMRTAPTGGFMGMRGLKSQVTNYQDARRFENQVEQISNEMRRIFRIPGEGALSDKEQAQIGVQLPSMKNDPAVNEDIVNTLLMRASNATSGSGQYAPDGSAAPAPAAPPQDDAAARLQALRARHAQ